MFDNVDFIIQFCTILLFPQIRLFVVNSFVVHYHCKESLRQLFFADPLSDILRQWRLQFQQNFQAKFNIFIASFFKYRVPTTQKINLQISSGKQTVADFFCLNALKLCEFIQDTLCIFNRRLNVLKRTFLFNQLNYFPYHWSVLCKRSEFLLISRLKITREQSLVVIVQSPGLCDTLSHYSRRSDSCHDFNKHLTQLCSSIVLLLVSSPLRVSLHISVLRRFSHLILGCKRDGNSGLTKRVQGVQMIRS